MGGTSNVLIQVKHEACSGEIVLVTTSPFLSVLHTNCFVRQWSSEWAQEASNSAENDQETQAWPDD